MFLIIIWTCSVRICRQHVDTNVEKNHFIRIRHVILKAIGNQINSPAGHKT